MSAPVSSSPAEATAPGTGFAAGGSPATDASRARDKRDALKAITVLTVTFNPALDWTLDVPGLTLGAVNRATAAPLRPGGKGVNVASALAATGHTVGVTGFLGVENDRVFVDHFAALGIDDEFVRVPGATRTGVKLVDPRSGTTTDINLPGLAPTPAAVAELARRIAESPAAWLVIGGSLPPGFLPVNLVTLITERRRRGGAVALDAAGDALRAGLAAGATVIKPNHRELEELVGRSLAGIPDVFAAGRNLLGAHPSLEWVLASLGERGACLISREACVVARPPFLRVHSTVGAGDAFLAGFIDARLRALDPAATARLATAYAMRALLRAAGDPDSAAALDPLAERIDVDVIP